jgi:hypothetical protein
MNPVVIHLFSDSGTIFDSESHIKNGGEKSIPSFSLSFQEQLKKREFKKNNTFKKYYMVAKLHMNIYYLCIISKVMLTIDVIFHTYTLTPHLLLLFFSLSSPPPPSSSSSSSFFFFLLLPPLPPLSSSSSSSSSFLSLSLNSLSSFRKQKSCV